jgi:putative ABC transport system permease protein
VLTRLLRTAPWRRAPLALVRQPSLLLTVGAVALVLGLAAAVGPLFLASTSSAVVQEDLTEGCPTVAGLRVSAFGRFTDEAPMTIAARDDALRGALTGIDHLNPTALTAVGPPIPVETIGGPDDIRVRLVYRSDVEREIEPVEDAGGDGVWIPERAAGELGIGAGGTMTLLTTPATSQEVRVRGVYRDIASPLPATWCAQERTVYPAGTGEAPDRLMFVDRATYRDLEATVNSNRSRLIWETTIDRRGLTLPEVERTADDLSAVASDLRVGSELAGHVGPLTTQLYLPDYVRVWQDTRAAVREGVLPVVLTAIAIALLFMFSVARSWVEQRRATVDLLVQRGVGPGWIGVKAMLELALPIVGFALAGWAVGVVAMRAFGPSSLLDARSLRTALASTIGLAVTGLALASAAVVSAVRRIEQDQRRLKAGAIAVVAELGLLLAAGLVYARVVDGDARLRQQRGATPHVDVLHLLFPILLIVGAGAVIVRLLVLALPVLRRAGGRWPLAAMLGIRRLAGSRHAVHVLGLAAVVATGLVAASSIVVASADATLHAKSAVFVGGVIAARIPDPVELPPDLRGRATLVTRYVNVHGPGGRPADLIGIDPATFADGAFWDESLADASLGELVGALAKHVDAGVPTIMVGDSTGSGTIEVGSGARAIEIPVTEVARAHAFPGERSKPLYVASTAALAAIDESDFAEVWSSTGTAAELVASLRAADVTVWGDVAADDVLTIGSFRTTAWTFGFLRALGSLIAVLTVAAVIAHVVARERRGRLGYAIARRCGVAARSYALSLAVELVVLLTSAFVVGGALGCIAAATTHHRLDGLRRLPPAPLFRIPGGSLGLAALASVVAVLIGARFAQRSSERADIVGVLRAEA